MLLLSGDVAGVVAGDVRAVVLLLVGRLGGLVEAEDIDIT